ncbi:MAG TPA: hypothetical protein DCP54_03805 [Chryseobacterium sp.]|nr:hypothetical protein [Chryseobacterium sp.]
MRFHFFSFFHALTKVYFSKFYYPFYSISGLTDRQIRKLEIKYFNGKAFPLCVRGFLLLAGKECPSLEFIHDGLVYDIQRITRLVLNMKGGCIERPFLVIDVGSIGKDFYFVYLDGDEDPMVFFAKLTAKKDSLQIHPLSLKLSEFIIHSLFDFILTKNLVPFKATFMKDLT